MKNYLLSSLFLCLSLVAFSAEKNTETVSENKAAKKAAFKEHLENHYKFYGLVRNFFTYDSRQCIFAAGELFHYIPKDVNYDMKGEDLNLQSSFKALAITTRLGIDVTGYKIAGMGIGAKVEADFCAGLSESSGTATLRLRQAYLTLGWDNLGKVGDGAIGMKIGQSWHPMSADLPDTFSISTGCPFGPFNRSPLFITDFNLNRNFSLTAGLIWQMQHMSTGPEGASVNYLKWSCIPEGYFGINYTTGGFLGRAGIDVLSICPRIQNSAGNKISERITTKSFFLYLQYKKDKFTAKAKTVFAEAGEHMNLSGGYGATSLDPTTGAYSYTPTRNSSTWVCLSYGKKIQGVLLLGYVKNFGTKDALLSSDSFYFSKSSAKNVNQLFRATPTIIYNIGKFTVGLEYELTGVQYGDIKKMNLTNGLCDQNLHWVINHRVQAQVKFTF